MQSSDEPVDGDAVDRILLDEASAALDGARIVVVLDAPSGALISAVSRRPGDLAPEHSPRVVRAYADSARDDRVAGERIRAEGLAIQRCEAADAGLFGGADVVLARLPQSLAALNELAEAIAHWSAPTVRWYAGGRVKHMSRGMNDVLARHFGSVRASLGRQKARVLIAEQPIPLVGQPGLSEPRRQRHNDLDVVVHAYGATFAGTSLDLGSRTLLSCFDRLPPTARTVLDLGCGSGILAVLAARQLPDAEILAVDDSRAAIRSTIATAQANGLADRITTLHAERLQAVAGSSVDLVVCNPPFHRGTARDSSGAYAMFADAARALRPGGELWVVYNSHLPYLNALRRTVGSSTVVAQNPKFTVVRSVRSGSRPLPSAAAPPPLEPPAAAPSPGTAAARA